MKKISVFLVLLLVLSNIKAQGVSIEFSIEWQKNTVYTIEELEVPDVKPVFLTITYRNISNKPLYFLKILNGVFDLPKFNLLHYPDDYVPPFTTYDNDTCRPFFKVMCQSNYSYWNIKKDSICGKEHFFLHYCVQKGDEPLKKLKIKNIDDGLSSSLGYIYSNIYSRFYPEFIDKSEWNYENDCPDSILSKLGYKFVSLKPDETYIDKYNLIGFQLIGGNFTFQLDNTKSLDYIEYYMISEKYDIENKQYQLPLKVGDYELFKDNFVSNKTSVFFEGVKREK